MTLDHPTRPTPSRGGQSGKFCHYCGRPLTVYQRFMGYDSKTGRKVYEEHKDCPLINSSWMKEPANVR